MSKFRRKKHQLKEKIIKKYIIKEMWVISVITNIYFGYRFILKQIVALSSGINPYTVNFKDKIPWEVLSERVRNSFMLVEYRTLLE